VPFCFPYCKPFLHPFLDPSSQLLTLLPAAQTFRHGVALQVAVLKKAQFFNKVVNEIYENSNGIKQGNMYFLTQI